MERIILEATICIEKDKLRRNVAADDKSNEWKKYKRGDRQMKFYKIDDQIVLSDKALSTGTELVANTTDAAGEKHVPVIIVTDAEVKVEVGAVEHPSLDAHYIEFILLETSYGIHTCWLKPGMKPEAKFKLVDGENPVAAFEYCNLHGLWMAKV